MHERFAVVFPLPLALAEIVDLLDPAASKWYELGLGLNVPAGQLDAIKGRDGAVLTCFIAMLEEWVNNHPDASKEKVITALRSPLVGEGNLAGCLLRGEG